MSPVFLLCVVLAASRTVSSVNLNEACNKESPNCDDQSAECNTDAVCKCKVGFTEKESKCVANATETTKPADSKPVETTPKSVSEKEKPAEKEKQSDLSQPATKAPSKVPSTNSTMTPPKKGSAAAIVFNIACLLTSVFLSLVVQA